MRGLSSIFTACSLVVGVLHNGTPCGAEKRRSVLPIRSGTDVPFMKTKAREHRQPNFPRGGASQQKPTPTSVLRGGSFSLKDYITDLFSGEKLPWSICFVLSLAYLVVFSFYNPSNDCADFKDGFCVTGLEPPPSPDGKDLSHCPTSPSNNSHEFAWKIDVVFTLVAIALGFSNISSQSLLIKVSIPAIIFGHGFLHKWISGESCNPSATIGEGYYKIFVAALVALNIWGFSSIPFFPHSLVWIVGLTIFIVGLTNSAAAEGNKAISSFFMTSQLLVSFTGAFFPSGIVTSLTGWTFILPCLVSLVEFLKCNWLKPLGGHAWYDVALHLSVLAALLPGDFFKNKENDKK